MITVRSGGALGSDSYWSQTAVRMGHAAIHMSTLGHRVSSSCHGRVCMVSREVLEEDHRETLMRAAESLGKHEPTKPYTRGLLLRNCVQFNEDTRAMYAIVESIKPPGGPELQRLPGGTAWTVVSYITAHNHAEVYVFVQDEKQWYSYNWSEGADERAWLPISSAEVPCIAPDPHGIDREYTTIGTRNLNSAGKRAIRSVFGIPTD